MTTCYFTIDRRGDDEWIQPTDLCRGPWDADACHAGPPSGMLARASERLVPDQRLARLTIDLTRPIPYTGFRVHAAVVRAGRTVSTTSLTLVDADGQEVVSARGLHMRDQPESDLPTPSPDTPHVSDAAPGRFAIERAAHGLTMFSSSIEMRYPDGHDNGTGPTTAWMNTVPLLSDEEVSGFARICPLADCGNAISRNADLEQFAFVNTDLTVAIHRDPVGEWFGTRAISRWERDGIGMSDALLFDDIGPVGRAIQTLLIRPQPRADA